MNQTKITIESTIRREPTPRTPDTANAIPEAIVGSRKLLLDAPWMSSLGLGIISSIILISPAIYIRFLIAKDSQQWYKYLKNSPATFEAFRWSILSAFFCLAFSVALTGCTLSPIATKHSKNEKIKSLGLIIGTLRTNVSFFVASLMMAIVYINSSLNDKNLETYNSDQNPNPFATYLGGIIDIIMKQKDNFKNIPYILILISAVFLVQKAVILLISLNFHKSFYTKRIKRNNLVLSCFETLSKSFASSNLKPIKSGSILKTEAINLYAKTIFEGLLKPGRNCLIIDDFLDEIDHPIATEFFAFLDFNKSGDISFSEFEESMIEAYDEKKNLLKAIKANEKVIDRIDNFFVSVILAYKVACFIPKVKWNVLDFIKYIGSSVFVLKYLFDHFLKQLFSSVMHFLVTHPYDVGDKILLDHTVYRIKDMGFWQTALISPDGQVSYVANHTLLSKAFGNYRRSDSMETNLLMSMSLKTSQEDIEMYVSACNEFIKDSGRYFDGHLVIKEVIIPNEDSIVLVFGVTHKFNFNNDDSLHFRCELIFNNMIRIAKEQNLKYYTLRFQGE